jgi:diadenosine tetraphosphate (Ap4A) HIT family hydrolase
MCAEGRPDVDPVGNVRFFAGLGCDAYLQREAPALGYTTVRWRGRHVADLGEMTGDELAGLWTDVARVARLLEDAFAPCHLNYEVLGNLVPHVHVHIVPRYLDDPCPNAPLKPWEPVPVDDAALREQLARLTGFAAHRPS